jgi:hypothetical protein
MEEMEKRGDREKKGTALPALHMHTFVNSMQRNRGQSVNAPLYNKADVDYIPTCVLPNRS